MEEAPGEAEEGRPPHRPDDEAAVEAAEALRRGEPEQRAEEADGWWVVWRSGEVEGDEKT